MISYLPFCQHITSSALLVNFKQSRCLIFIGTEGYAVASGHKFGALPGCGFVLIRNTEQFNPLILGGEQEKGLRSGTQCYFLAYIMSEALALKIRKIKGNTKFILAHRKFEKALTAIHPNVVIFGANADRLSGTTMVALPPVKSHVLQAHLELNGILVSTGSACSDKKKSLSKTLLSMGVPKETAECAIRICLDVNTDWRTYDKILNSLSIIYSKNRENI